MIKKNEPGPTMGPKKTGMLAGKNSLILVLLIVGSFVAITTPFFIRVEMNMSQDAYWYMALAKNITDKGAYSTIADIPHLKYLPGFPILIALTHKAVPDYLLASRLTAYFFGILTIVLAFFYGRKISPLAGVLGAFFASGFALLANYSLFGMTETSFIFFSFGGALLVLDNKKSTRKEKSLYLLGFALIGFSILIRYTGIVALAAVLILEWLKNREKGTAMHKEPLFIAGIAIALLVVLPWGMFVAQQGLQDGLIFKTDYLSQKKPADLLGVANAFLDLNPIIITGLIIGIWVYAKSEYKNPLLDFLILFLIGFFILHIWWGWTNFRFFTVLVIVASTFLAFMGNWLAKNNRLKTLFLLLAIYLAVQVALFDTMEENYYSNSANLSKIKEASSWIKENVPASSGLVVADIPIYNYYLRREELRTIFEYDSLANLLETPKNDVWIIVDGSHLWASRGIVEYNPDRIIIPEKEGGQAVNKTYPLKFVNAIQGSALKTPLLQSDYYVGFVKIYHVEKSQNELGEKP